MVWCLCKSEMNLKKKRRWNKEATLGRARETKYRSPEACGQNTNDHYIKHPVVHFDQNALKPQQALLLLTSEFINPVGVTARKHKIHWLPCSPSDLTVCLSAPPSLPDCSLLQHSHWDNGTMSQYDAPGVVLVTALISPVTLLCTHTSVMIVMVFKRFAVNAGSRREAAACVRACIVCNTRDSPLLLFSNSGLLTVRLHYRHQSWEEDLLWNEAALLHHAADAPVVWCAAPVSLFLQTNCPIIKGQVKIKIW